MGCYFARISRAAIWLNGTKVLVSEGAPVNRCKIAVMRPKKRPTVTPIEEPTLFEMAKLGDGGRSAYLPDAERPYSESGVFLETSSFTASGWSGSFYPVGMKSTDYLAYYATRFVTVEIDSTFYGCPSSARTPDDFLFCVKVPQVFLPPPHPLRSPFLFEERSCVVKLVDDHGTVKLRCLSCRNRQHPTESVQIRER